MDIQERSEIHSALGDPIRLRMVDLLLISDHSPAELAEILEIPTNLAAHHLGVLERVELVRRRPSSGDARRRYVILDRERLANASMPGPTIKGPVLFVCTHNSARSQFAAELWRDRAGGASESAGSQPARAVHPAAIRAASEYGVDLSTKEPRGYGAVTLTPATTISVCDRALEAQIPFQGEHIHWSIPDPVADGRIGAFRAAFGEIARRVELALGVDGS